MRGAFWWIDRWRKSTAYTDMTLAEQGAYRNLLDELWLRDGVIPDDERTLARACGDPLEWPAVREKVLAHLRLTPEGWRNETHDEVAATSRAQAEKGRKRAAVAERDGGRFTSRSPAGTPAKSPAARPAGNQPQPPADDQPPYTVHRTPDPSNGLPSLRSGDVLPPVVSVPASVRGATDSPLVKSPRAAPAEPEHPEDVAWSRDACDAWLERFGGAVPGGQIGRALKPLVQKHGWPAVRPAWRTYLGSAQAEYASAARFAATYGDWAARVGRPLPL